MRKKDIKVAILRMEGTNCEQEVLDAFAYLGASPQFIHIKQLKQLRDYQCLVIPGGFSAGDSVRAGAIFASLIKSKIFNELKEFIERGYLVLGICNGFQILVELGLLPGKGGGKACLTPNDSARYECRPTLVRYENRGNCVFTRSLKKGEIRMMPCAHAEGKLILENPKESLAKLEANDQIVFRWVDPRGKLAGYPWNPNGSFDNLAGLCNLEGNMLGLMPHPERSFFRWQHPEWVRKGLSSPLGYNVGDGRVIFESIIDYISKKF
jgi:phosphoribosylformylglycinamidine synthase